MGLTIHYSGSIDRVEKVEPFVEELSDIADSMGWMAQAINMEEPDPSFRGVIVNPSGDCEPLRFLFDRKGRMRNMMDLIDEQVEPGPYSFFNATKTQFAEIKTHVWIIGLLRYLKKRYMSDLKVTDEGEYWETEDLQKLHEKKQFLGGMTDKMAGALSEAEPLPEGASVDDIVARIEEIAKGLHEGKND